MVRAVATRVPDAPGDDCVRVAVDGPDGAGKDVLVDDTDFDPPGAALTT